MDCRAALREQYVGLVHRVIVAVGDDDPKMSSQRYPNHATCDDVSSEV